jgi:putative hemolysin
LRTALLPSELVSKQDTAINITIGAAIRPDLILRLKTDLERAAWFRLRTYGLEHSESFESAANRKLTPITKPVPSESIAHELSRLPHSALLLSYGPYRVYFFEHDDAPITMQEIGRLRELSFRAVDEGTGRASDLDRFDQDYRHLLLWDVSTNSIVGSYRLAFCDEITQKHGPAGLYSNTLFRYKRPMLSILSNSIELGRSFIRPDYQKKPLPLALLWRGIGVVLSRYPKYRQLIGPVTISNRYRGASGRLLLTYLRQLQETNPLHKQVVARSPVVLRQNEFERQFCRTSNISPKSLSSLLSELDDDGKRIPVLLERYLELGASVLGINRDPSFGNCIDALLVVELEKIPEPLLKRFLGTDGLARCNGSWRLAS